MCDDAGYEKELLEVKKMPLRVIGESWCWSKRKKIGNKKDGYEGD